MQHYRKAYSLLFECEVYIVNVYYNRGEWIFICEEDVVGLRDHVFKERELINFK
jgi:hypothetical protein